MDTLAEPTGAVLDLTLLRTFLEVVDNGGFALAADALALTPSAVSGHIKRLEMVAGSVLLERTTRSFELTAAGEVFRRADAQPPFQAHAAQAGA